MTIASYRGLDGNGYSADQFFNVVLGTRLTEDEENDLLALFRAL